MNAIQDKCRPKHQVLVLKCYPKTSKGAVDVVPNSSELSYLLFYATSRRSKIQKIGAFLEKKTANDVWRMRIGNVQVTLGILAAIVEKSPKDAVLIAPCVLKVLELILRSDDITMVESSLPTFEAFCQHHDLSSLFGDSAYLQQYQSVVQSYAQLASTRHVPAKGPVSKPLQFRWRNAGLEAIKHVAGSDALSSVSGRQIDVIVPMILENMWSADDRIFDTLLERVQMEGKPVSDKRLHRRSSIAAEKAAETSGDTNPLALSGTAVDVDNLAEEDTGVSATQCLKSIFVIPNRAQIYGATNALLKFISKRVAEGETLLTTDKTSGSDLGWAIKVYDIIARWAPVQDRYVILLATMDVLNQTPMREESLQRHLTFTAMMQSLLRSDVNLIGLSVMDVLLGLVRQIKKLFHLQHKGSSHDSSQSDERTDTEQETTPSRSQCAELLERLECCSSDLANHVYYADQVSDMIAALFGRIRHSRSTSIASLAGAAAAAERGEDHHGAEGTAAPPYAADLSRSQSLQETYFSHSNGRQSALKIIKSILLTASPKNGLGNNSNNKNNNNNNMGLSRNRVPIQAWEGTQWLLRDPIGDVRRAYVDALTTWLDREMARVDLIATDDFLTVSQGPGPGKAGREVPGARRVASSTCNRERQQRARRCQFLPLLHLAIYDSALQFVDYDNDMILLHGLLSKLVFKLGVNAARYGIPMVYRLQEDIQVLEQPIHKVRIASLCHGYFWALAEKFDFEASVVGRAIYNEISRRKNKGFWVQGVHIPAPTPMQVGPPGVARPHLQWNLGSLETEEILPFDDRSSLVECIAASYRETNLSPPTSPAASPNRTQNGPVLGFNTGAIPTTRDGARERECEREELPHQFRENMLSEWCRESALAAITAAGKAESVSGSKAGTTGTRENRLTINTGTAGPNGSSNGFWFGSPIESQQNARPQTVQTHGGGGLTPVSKLRNASMFGRLPPSDSVTSRMGVVASVEQLKTVLSGRVSRESAAGIAGAEDGSDESMTSCEYSMSDDTTSFNPAASSTEAPTTAAGVGEALARSVSASASVRGPVCSNTSTSAHEGGSCAAQTFYGGNNDEVPPVPPLPNLSTLSSRVGTQPSEFSGAKRNWSGHAVGGESFQSTCMHFRQESSKSMDLQELLRGIDSRWGEGSLGNSAKPPY
ncbi:uncharacterized protein UV8b_04070 [Ustilaginoidea virens]|uniref:Protein EFR3 n=1 Tax=Ustilaginoidea virens TaxID=1159556 RepID=A0A8E5HRH9_USTVR|nr:uncharacterized protein UV8b_04070 [Ustilaginoidea virens]QUC19829.1 hypothetical protein UV8b_04070 [Ustilaginoidea virens]